MRFKIDDSEPNVKPESSEEFRINGVDPAKLPYMVVKASNRDDAVSSYVRMRIRQWETAGRARIRNRLLDFGI